MRKYAGYLLIGCLAAMAAGAVTLTGLGYAVHARPAVERGGVIQYVDRSNKSDRLDLEGPVDGQAVPKTTRGSPPARAQQVPLGCDPAFSPLTNGHLNFPARCAS